MLHYLTLLDVDRLNIVQFAREAGKILADTTRVTPPLRNHAATVAQGSDPGWPSTIRRHPWVSRHPDDMRPLPSRHRHTPLLKGAYRHILQSKGRRGCAARNRLGRSFEPPQNTKDNVMSEAARSELAPQGVLRAAINLSNFLLVTGHTPSGEPQGVAPDMARAVAARLGVPITYVAYATPGELADAATSGAWDIGLIGAEPARAGAITFSPAYVEIPATYLVPPDSHLRNIEEVDRAGIRIAVTARTAYDLWLERHIEYAALVRSASLDGAFDDFASQRLDVLAGLRSRLTTDAAKMPGSRILDGQFTAVQQAIGTLPRHHAGAAFLRDFVEGAKMSGLVADLIVRHRVIGLSVAPAA
jgi:polar amino acid transport system substrate-binding protein